MFQFSMKSGIMVIRKIRLVLSGAKEEFMGGPYNIPRNYKGENKILFIFSTKAFIYTGIGGAIGLIFYYILKMFGYTTVGIGVVLFLAAIGFAIGTFKIPETSSFEFTKKTGGEDIDQVILRWFKFKQKKNRIYVYKEEEHKDGK